MGILAVSVFAKGTAIHCPVRVPNKESTTLRLPSCILIHLAASPLLRILALTVFPKETTARYTQREHCISKLTITICYSNRLSYAAAATKLCPHHWLIMATAHNRTHNILTKKHGAEMSSTESFCYTGKHLPTLY